MLDWRLRVSKLELNDFVKYVALFELYGKLLTGDRQKILADYFQYNMTLAEIAKERNVSRQAVLDAIAKSCKKLDEYEEKLKLNFQRLEIVEDLKQILNQTDDETIKQKVDNIIRKI